MQYSPPPLFKQGASARAKVAFFSCFAILLLVVDTRMHSLGVVRKIVGTVLYPVQMVAMAPRDVVENMSHYFVSTDSLIKENAALKAQIISNAISLQQSSLIVTENAHLRSLAQVGERQSVKSITAEILYDAHDAFTRKIILNRGSHHGVELSQPVIDNLGVVGQVTRVFSLTSEVTLLTDKNQAIPVQIARNGLRSVVYGRGQSSYLDMRMTTSADVKNGDILVTSGIDGIYPAGLAVAKVIQAESKGSTTFETVLCTPLAGIEKNRQLLILMISTNNLPRPETEDVRAKKEKINRKVTRDNIKEPAVDLIATPASIAATELNNRLPKDIAIKASASPASSTSLSEPAAKVNPLDKLPAKELPGRNITRKPVNE